MFRDTTGPLEGGGLEGPDPPAPSQTIDTARVCLRCRDRCHGPHQLLRAGAVTTDHISTCALPLCVRSHQLRCCRPPPKPPIAVLSTSHANFFSPVEKLENQPVLKGRTRLPTIALHDSECEERSRDPVPSTRRLARVVSKQEPRQDIPANQNRPESSCKSAIHFRRKNHVRNQYAHWLRG